MPTPPSDRSHGLLPPLRAGRDKLSGGSGGDTLVMLSQGELVAGDLFDGGFGVDTLILAEGVSLSSGVTLTSIEVVLYDGY